MITVKQLNEINQLNVLMYNSEMFKTAIYADKTLRNRYNITTCTNVVELYSYIYKHYDKIGTIFCTDTNGNIDMYLGNKIFKYLISAMNNRRLTPKQAIDELYRVRKTTDCKGELE